MAKDLKTIILAAGKGTRMKSDVPKVLHSVCGKPIIRHVLDVVKGLGSLKTYLVLGHKSDVIKAALTDELVFVKQPKMLGTADAVKCTQNYFKGDAGNVLILCGDTPLLSKGTVKKVLQKHKKSGAVCTLLTTVVHDPSGYGRIIRDDNGRAVAIREDRDATGYERDIGEINVGVYCCQSKDLFKALGEIKINKSKKEFYFN